MASNVHPGLPTRFPCWCRAVYSWGGESDKDLGFIEGDLIECLNAGDGSWWTGRLRRDRRMIGLFPSNFVTVMDDSFRPASRATSPMPGIQQQLPQKRKSNMRKPFSGYKTETPAPSTTRAKVVAAKPPNTISKPPAPVQEQAYNVANPPSTVLWEMGSSSRQPSRSPSPMPLHDVGSPPPPPPPPHRVALGRRTPSPQPMEMNDRYLHFSRTPSPQPPSLNGHTPPMLRHAMDDVMSSLKDMGMSEEESESGAAAFNPWSPEAFDELHKPSMQRPDPRPLTSLGLSAGGSSYLEQQAYSSHHNMPERYDDGTPQLSSYVERMERRLRQMQDQASGHYQEAQDGLPPAPPPKNSPFHSRPGSAMAGRRPSIQNRKSAYELGRSVLNRTLTGKSSATNSSSGVKSNATFSSTQTSMTSQSIMSGHSAGGFSATSAGSLARRNKFNNVDRERPVTSAGTRGYEFRPQTPLKTTALNPSRDSRQGAQSAVGWETVNGFGGSSGLGGLVSPKSKKTGFFKKLIEGAKTGAASARSNIAASESASSPHKTTFGGGLTGIAGGTGFSAPGQGRNAAREMGLGGGNNDWLKMRQDVNRSNTPGPTERQERADRCLMLDHPVICAVDELFETAEGAEGADGSPVPDPFQINNPGLSLVDKAARFITSLPPMTNAASLAQGYVCRPYRSDVQRLRAIFTWISERVAWEEEFEGDVDTRRVVQSKRGCSHELAVLVVEMCQAINLHAEVVRGYLKTPGEDLDLDALNQPNHYWNAILVDNEWRMMDCALASPTNPRRALFSSISSSIAEPFYFLTKPLELCHTHIPVDAAHQHIVPPISPDVLLALPSALPAYFRQSLSMHGYDTSAIRLDALEMCVLSINVPADVEVVAEVETRAFLRDPDGDVYENGDAVTKTRALTQAAWYTTPPPPSSSKPNHHHHNLLLQKRYVVKALLPGDEGMGVLKVYAGKKGLMHSTKDIPHPLAMVVPLYHQGENPAYEFLVRHPTPHATRQDLYVLQPQCRRLCADETYIFAVRQHAASVTTTTSADHHHHQQQYGGDGLPTSPNPNMRPTSAMSMTSSAAGSGSGSGSGSGGSGSWGSEQVSSSSLVVGSGGAVRPNKDKPAKLAVQSPGGKILRLNRKPDATLPRPAARESDGDVQGTVWETVVKVQERGVWRGLVLADRTARWCVWGEWECC